MRADKQKVIDEVWDDERIRSFLDKSPPDQPGDPDFYVLRHAYQSMRADDFSTFLEMFRASGRDVGAKDQDGRTLAQCIEGHAQSQPYLAALNRA